jgi:hypothetical protein
MTAVEKGIRLERRVVLITTCSALAAALDIRWDATIQEEIIQFLLQSVEVQKKLCLLHAQAC